uniref:Phosphotransferase n=1 Tax=Geobacter sp. (strain M21) TaxID=443144 RepID=C6E5V7_GEOSM
MSILLVFDDRRGVEVELTALIGTARFGDIVFRRQTLYDRMCSLVHKLGWQIIRVDSADTSDGFDQKMAEGHSRVVHVASWLVPTVETIALDRLERVGIVSDSCLATLNGMPMPLIATSAESYAESLSSFAMPDAQNAMVQVSFDSAFVDISNLSGMVDFLSGAFGSRHFNNVTRTRQQVVKFSADIGKIKAEHDYYHLLPESMRRWFVMPYDLKKDEDGASYTMERLLVLDMGQQWINGGLSVNDFQRFLEDVVRFLDERPKRSCSRDKALANFDQLYVNKVKNRLKEFESHPLCSYLDDMLRNGTEVKSLCELFDRYFDLLSPYRQRVPHFETIGHGDPCFSNILYDKRIRLLKLIDPKGATARDELYTDPFYDYAKLSHSVLGGYDFITNGLCSVFIDKDLRLRLQTPEPDFDAYASRFISCLESADIEMRQVRLYEASLFLSMLPLHRDNPQSVLAFALVAAHIIKEVGVQ